MTDSQPDAPRSWDNDDLDISLDKPVDFPATMLLAGIFWLLAGVGTLGLSMLVWLLGGDMHAFQVLLLAGAVSFIYDGIQLIRGRFRDPLGDGILTVLIGLFFLGKVGLDAAQGGFGVALLLFVPMGLVFLIPGVLVLIGRKKYLAWKEYYGY